jgi:hypothetical protein
MFISNINKYHAMRERLLWLCTCTSLEIMTAVGVTAYLLYLGQATLAIVSGIVFAKVIVFHFAIEVHERIKRGKALVERFA